MSNYDYIEETLKERLNRLCDEMKDDIDHIIDWYIIELEQKNMTPQEIKDWLDEESSFYLSLGDERKQFALHNVCESDYM